jgi:hypothetical protein
MGFRDRNDFNERCSEEQKHVHEVQGSVRTADPDDPHQHRFCTVTGEARPCNEDDHFHEVEFSTDTYENHHHEFKGRTGGAIPVGNRHVHFLESVTSINDQHQHEFEFATLINNPTGEEDNHENRFFMGDFNDFRMDEDRSTSEHRHHMKKHRR